MSTAEAAGAAVVLAVLSLVHEAPSMDARATIDSLSHSQGHGGGREKAELAVSLYFLG